MAEQDIPIDTPFEDASQQYRAEMAGMWLFLATEVMFFGGLFAAFAVYRTQFPDAFAEAASHLDLPLASVNTAILLTSGLTMALAEPAMKAGDRARCRRFLWATLALGTLFLGLKAYEYSVEAAHGLMPIAGLPFRYGGTDPGRAEIFFDLYYAMTGLHALHMVIGLVMLWLMIRLTTREPDGHGLTRRIQVTGLYWAFVDIAWVFVFTSLYLLGGAP